MVPWRGEERDTDNASGRTADAGLRQEIASAIADDLIYVNDTLSDFTLAEPTTPISWGWDGGAGDSGKWRHRRSLGR